MFHVKHLSFSSVTIIGCPSVCLYPLPRFSCRSIDSTAYLAEVLLSSCRLFYISYKSYFAVLPLYSISGRGYLAVLPLYSMFHRGSFDGIPGFRGYFFGVGLTFFMTTNLWSYQNKVPSTVFIRASPPPKM